MDQSEEMEIQSNEEVISTTRKKSIIITSFRAVWDKFFLFERREIGQKKKEEQRKQKMYRRRGQNAACLNGTAGLSKLVITD